MFSQIKPAHDTCNTKGRMLGTFTRRILLIGFAVFASTAFASQTDPRLSEQLPVGLMKELIRDRLWDDRFDQVGPLQSELGQFWTDLIKGPTDDQRLIDSLFGLGSQKNLALPSPALYSLKFRFLRFAKAANIIDAARAEHIDGLWRKAYIDAALTYLEATQVPEYTAQVEIEGQQLPSALNNFRKRVEAKQINIVDLSPEERERLDRDEHLEASHGVRILRKNERTGEYLVHGLYEAHSGYFALDFSKPVSQTLITFAHELIHAADPRIEHYAKQYRELTPKVIEILRSWTGGIDVVKRIVSFETLEHALDRDSMSEVLKFISDKSHEEAAMAKNRFDQHQNEASKKPTLYKLSPQDDQTIKSWIQVYWGLTVENEYRAYGASLAAYARLKNQLGLILPDSSRKLFLDAFARGDENFVLFLQAQGMGPQSLFFFVRENLKDPIGAPAKSEEQLQNISAAKDYLVSTLNVVAEEFRKKVGNRFFEIINTSEALTKQEQDSVLPDWAQPGGFLLPSNPTTLINAKVSTLMTLRFRENLSLIHRSLRKSILPLMTLSTGVLDLHDVSIGELKLIGVFYTNPLLPKIPQAITSDPVLSLDLDAIPPEVRSQFSLVELTPEMKSRPQPISSFEVGRNLTKMRLLKTGYFLESAWPSLGMSVAGSRTFLQKLKNDLMSTDSSAGADDETLDLRRQALVRELLDALNSGSAISDEVSRLKLLAHELGQYYRLAEVSSDTDQDAQLIDVARRFDSKAKLVIARLDDLGVFGTESFREGQQKIDASRTAFRSQLKTFASQHCSSKSGRPEEVTPHFNAGPFSVDEFSFKLMLLCHKGLLYGVRLPGDFTDYMTTFAPRGKPEFRVFMGHRGIVGDPIVFQNERKK
jgi:hypothetical protein